MRGLFVTGTDTGVGKTVLSGAIVAGLRARGGSVRALKPVITGVDEPPDAVWPSDDRLLAEVSGVTPEEVTLRRYGPPVSPHLAIALSGGSLDPNALLTELAHRAGDADQVIVEGAGGLLVPICEGYDMRALARDLGLPVLIAARAGLGTINHTLLTVEAARRAGLEVAGVVLSPWPAIPGQLEESNRETIARLGGLPVAVLAQIARPTPRLLAAAGATLPLSDWFGDPGQELAPAA
jgi:dethiobiotin synthetase